MQPKPKSFQASQYHLMQAGAFCALMLSNGISFEEVAMQRVGAFRKSYRSDIDKIHLLYKNELKQFIIKLSLNRDGIYDRLPEGLFHQSKGNNKTLTTAEKVAEHRRYREEERDARRFFQPVEQELFRYSVQIKLEEFEAAFGLLNADIKEDLNALWELPEDLPAEAAGRFMRVLPWIKSIKGNAALTARVLSLILAKEVVLKKYTTEVQHGSGLSFSLGDGMLGVDTITGDGFWEPFACWEFQINDLEPIELALYLPHQPFGKLLQQFETFFIPLEVDAVFELGIGQDVASVALEEAILGYSLVL